jgi:hypothetical protein
VLKVPSFCDLDSLLSQAPYPPFLSYEEEERVIVKTEPDWPPVKLESEAEAEEPAIIKSESEIPQEELEEEEEEEVSEIVDKAERRRVANKESARRSRTRKKEQLDRLETLESVISGFIPFGPTIDNSKYSNELIVLRKLCLTDTSTALPKIQEFLIKIIEENSLLYNNLNKIRNRLHTLSNP